MPTVANFRLNPLFEAFPALKFNDAIVGEFLTIAVLEIGEHQQCLGVHFDRCCYLLVAHRLTKWQAAGTANSASVGALSVSELRDVVSSLSVSDEAGSESITFKPSSSSDSGKYDPDELDSTTYGRLYQKLFDQFKCRRSWMVTGGYTAYSQPDTATEFRVPPPTPIVPSALRFGEFLVQFSFGDSTPKLLDLPITGIVDRVVVGINTAFNVPSTLSIGTSDNPALLMGASQNLPTEVGQFESFPSANLINKQIILTIVPGLGISQGFGFVIVEYSVP